MISLPFVQGKYGSNDLVSHLLDNRIVMLNGEVNEDSAFLVVSSLLYLDSISHDPISLYVNSCGGVVVEGLAIIDTMNAIKSPVNTIVTGMAASMGFVIAVSGSKRMALENSTLLSHQVLGGAYGQTSDVIIQAEYMKKLNEKLMKIIADNSFLTVEEVTKMSDRDNYMSSYESLSYGFLDSIIKPSDKIVE